MLSHYITPSGSAHRSILTNVGKRFASIHSGVSTSQRGRKHPFRLCKSTPTGTDAILRVVEFLDVELRWVRLFLSRIISSQRNNIGALSRNNRAGDEVLDNAASYLLQSPGKLIRPALVLLMSYCCIPSNRSVQKIKKGLETDIRRMEASSAKGRRVPERDVIGAYMYPKLPHNFEKILTLASVTELMHVASLLHDDVIDGAAMRRGKQTLARVSGTKVSVLAGDYLFSRACGISTTLGSMPVVSLISSALEELVRGELLQMGTITDEATYFEKNHRKTGSLLEKSLTSSMILMRRTARSANSRNAGKIGMHLGQAFQIVDDCLDFTGTEATTGKPRFTDLKEGIFTLPVMLAAKKDKSLHTLMRKPINENAIRHIAQSVELLGTVERSKAIAYREFDQAMRYLHKFPQSEARNLLEAIANFILERHA